MHTFSRYVERLRGIKRRVLAGWPAPAGLLQGESCFTDTSVKSGLVCIMHHIVCLYYFVSSCFSFRENNIPTPGADKRENALKVFIIVSCSFFCTANTIQNEEKQRKGALLFGDG